jgi:hypothetical protein
LSSLFINLGKLEVTLANLSLQTIA